MTSVAYVGADADGRIRFQGIVPEGMYEIQAPPAGGSLVIGAGEPATHRVVNGEIVERPVNPAALEGQSLIDVPSGAIVSIDGTTYPDPVTDRRVDLTFAESGVHSVTLSCWPERDATFEVQS